MQDEGKCLVPIRSAGEDISEWMNKVRIAITEDHHKRNALCIQTKMEYVKIPVPENAPYLGAEPKLNS